MNLDSMIDFPGYFFLVDEYYTLMANEDGEIICVIQDAFFNRH